MKALPWSTWALFLKDINYYDRALELSLQGLQIFHKLDDKPRKALALYEIGNNAMHLGKWDMAQRHFSDAHTLYKELGIMAHLAALYWCQGFLYHMLGNEDQSEEAYLTCL